MTPEQQRIKDSVLNLFDSRIREWNPRGPARAMAEVYAADRKELRKVYTSIAQDRLIEAETLAGKLEMIVREVVPEDAWNYIANYK